MRTKLEEKKQKNIFQGFFFKIVSRWRNQACCGFRMGKRFPYSEIVSILVKKTGLASCLGLIRISYNIFGKKKQTP